jgi:NAD(P)-dependent dehydrogenase (short-subunit alcohol dehydrogenase family)
MDITNASAIVTGGAGGFGMATARRLAEKGAKVVIADVNAERGEALAKELNNGSTFVHTDIMDEASIENAIQTAVGLGPLRAAVVVHSGPPFPGATGPQRTVNREGKRIPLAQFAHTVNIFLNQAFAVTSQAAEAMARNEPLGSGQRGVIINTASIAGYEGQPGQAAYSAAKGGIIGMTLTLARDLAPLGIRAMAIAPGTFLTFAYRGRMTDEQAQAHWSPSIPNPKRMGDPDEYAILAAHIVENDFLNGTTIRLDAAQRF